MKRHFIINPHAGKGIGKAEISSIKRYFVEKTGCFDFTVAGTREEAIRVTRRLLMSEVHQIVAVGGDGTVNAIANGFFENGELICKESVLGLARAGSGADYIKSIVGKKASSAWQGVILNPDIRAVDIGLLRFSSPLLKDHYFVNMASVGMIADIVKRKEKSPSFLPKGIRYLVPSLAALFLTKPVTVSMTLDNRVLEMEVLTISISKGSYAGGGMHFGGGVGSADGFFDVTVFGRMHPLRMLASFSKMYSGSLTSLKAIHKFRVQRISIDSPEPVPIEFDGELYGNTGVDVSVRPRVLRVCFPQA